jgi:uncharacterized protein
MNHDLLYPPLLLAKPLKHVSRVSPEQRQPRNSQPWLRPLTHPFQRALISRAVAPAVPDLPEIWRRMETMTKKRLITSDTIRRMAVRIARRFKPERIILFGSRARGDARADSDVDLLVVMPVQGSRRAVQLEIRLALQHGFATVPTDVIVVTPGEYESDARIPGTIVRPAVREGKVLYVRG